MLDIGQRAIELMFPVYGHTDEKKDYLSIYLSIVCSMVLAWLKYPLIKERFGYFSLTVSISCSTVRLCLRQTNQMTC